MTYGKRLDQALTYAGKSRKDLADILECTPQAIGIVITWNGEKDRKLATEAHAEAAHFLNVDGYWLATGKGEKELVSNQALTPINGPETVNFEAALRVVAVALSQADQSDREAAKVYFNGLCDRPQEVDTFAAKLQRVLVPLPKQVNGTNH